MTGRVAAQKEIVHGCKEPALQHWRRPGRGVRGWGAIELEPIRPDRMITPTASEGSAAKS